MDAMMPMVFGHWAGTQSREPTRFLSLAERLSGVSKVQEALPLGCLVSSSSSVAD